MQMATSIDQKLLILALRYRARKNTLYFRRNSENGANTKYLSARRHGKIREEFFCWHIPGAEKAAWTVSFDPKLFSA
jgi:hypothetical protein